MPVTTTTIGSSPTDPIGEAFHHVRMSGTFYCHSELTAPWGLYLPPMPECVWFHVVTRGYCRLEADDSDPRELRAGDLALIPHGHGHRIHSDANTAAPSVIDLPHEYLSDHYALLHHGGGGSNTTLICGAIRFTHPATRQIINRLPALIQMDAPTALDAQWLRDTLRMIQVEAANLRPGGAAIITRLSDVLVIQAIRAWLDNEPEAKTGWLAALTDAQLGPAIQLIHRHPDRHWTVDSLAAEAAMSRSAFSARFTSVVGESVKSYLTRWRMHLAWDRLRHDNVTSSEIAGQCGYYSVAAFSRAFKRVHGIPPGAAKPDNAPPLQLPSTRAER